MSLFPENILPFDGHASYHGPIMPVDAAQAMFHSLEKTLAWKHDELIIFGRRITTRRMTAWHGDAPFAYTYSHQTRQALPWTPELRVLKTLCEQHSGHPFNSCLLNLYHDGSEGMGWHSDDESTLDPTAAIASISLGAERKFSFRHRGTKETRSIMLEHGSLLVMEAPTQAFWQHSLPVSKKVSDPRINLTFRRMLT